MSIFTFDPSSYTVGDEPTDIWTNQLNTNAGGVVIANDGSDNYLEWTANSGARSFLIFAPAGQNVDTETLALIKLVSSDAGCAFQLEAATTAFTGILSYYSPTTLSIQYRIAGSTQSLPSGSYTHAENTTDYKYWIKTRSVGSSIKIKIWNYGDTEPTEWSIESADGPELTGYNGLFSYNTGFDVYSYQVATGTDISDLVVDGEESLIMDQAEATFSSELTGTASFNDGTDATATDVNGNVTTLENFVNNGDNTYSFSLPAYADGTVGLTPGTLTITITNGTGSATDTIDFVPIDGYSELVATTQSTELSTGDHGYVSTEGLDNALTVGDIIWTPYSGDSTDGTTDTSSITESTTITRYYFDADDTFIWSSTAITYEAETATNTAPTVTIQNTSFSVPYGTAWSDSLLGTITTSDDSDTVTYTVDSSAYIANTAGAYEIVVTTSADSGGLTGTASAFVTVEAEVVETSYTFEFPAPLGDGNKYASTQTGVQYQVYAVADLGTLVASGTVDIVKGEAPAWDQAECTTGVDYVILLVSSDGTESGAIVLTAG